MISCYIPCYNHGRYLPKVIAAVRAQTRPVDELFVVDDASTDDSVEMAKALGARVLALKRNAGRGFVRALAMSTARHEWVFSCDSSNVIGPDYLERALGLFDDERVAGVFGLIHSQPGTGLCNRWRDRHLFRVAERRETGIVRNAHLSTACALVRKGPVLKAGNYNSRLRQSEDYELSLRVEQLGYRFVFDPTLRLETLQAATLGHVLERYSRWMGGYGGALGWAEYGRKILRSVKNLAMLDLWEADPCCALISLLYPHYHFIASRTGKSLADGPEFPAREADFMREIVVPEDKKPAGELARA